MGEINMKSKEKIILKYVTISMVLTTLYKAKDIYDMNRLKGYKELTNPHLTIEIDYTDYKELNIEELEKDIRTNDENEYLIEFKIKGSNNLKRLLFTEEYILKNPNYLDTEDIPIRDKNMLEAIKSGNIIVNKIWRKKREEVSYLNIEEKFKEENLSHEFTITRKDSTCREAKIKFLEDKNGDIKTYCKYTKCNGKYPIIECLGPSFDKVENLDEYTKDDYLMILPVDYVEEIDALNPTAEGIKELGKNNFSFEQLQKLNIRRAYIQEEKTVSVDEFKKLLYSDELFDFSSDIYLKKPLLDTKYYTRTKREILKNDDLGIMNLIKEGKVSSINISLKKGTSIIRDNMKGKTLYIFTERYLLVAEYNEKIGVYDTFTYEFENDIDKVNDIKKDKLHYIKSIFK